MIGSAMSKLLNLAILPYITTMLTTEQYGLFDLVQTITSVALPVFTFQTIESAFRFVYLEKYERKGQVLTNVWFCIVVGTTLFVIISLIIDFLIIDIKFIYYLVIFYIFNVLMNMYQRIARSLNRNTVFALSGMIQTFSLLSFQYCLLNFWNMKAEGLIYAYALSVIVTCIYIETQVKSLQMLSIRSIKIGVIKKLIRFSAPLIPNSISWWGVSSINRLIIVATLGYSANGIFSMSNKFASVITLITNTFHLAWQEYVLIEKDNPERTHLFSGVFKHYLMIVSLITSLGILFQQLFFNILIDPAYFESYYYIPIVMIGVGISSVGSFYGAGYFAYEKTINAFFTTIVGAIVNIAMCILTVKNFGLYGIAFSSAIAYLIIWIARHHSMKKYFCINFKIRNLLLSIIVLFFSISIYYKNNNIYSIIGIAIVCVIFIAFNHKLIFRFFLDR